MVNPSQFEWRNAADSDFLQQGLRLSFLLLNGPSASYPDRERLHVPSS